MSYGRTKGVPRYESEPQSYFPADRVRGLIADAIEKRERERPRDARASGWTNPFAGSHATVAAESGVSVRWIYAILNGERDSVALDKLERVFEALNLTPWFYVPPEEGGLRDLYFDPRVVGDDFEAVSEKAGELLDLGRARRREFEAASLAQRASVERNPFLAASLAHRARLAAARDREAMREAA